jgi:hypothetical protein
VAGVYVKLDAEYAADPKVLRAGALAELLYIRSLALAKRRLENGHIDTVQLPGLCLGIPGKPATHAQALVDAGLWDTNGDGWNITAWLKHNKSREAVEEHTKRKADAGAKGAHNKWHSAEKPMATCDYCITKGWVSDDN